MVLGESEIAKGVVKVTELLPVKPTFKLLAKPASCLEQYLAKYVTYIQYCRFCLGLYVSIIWILYEGAICEHEGGGRSSKERVGS